MSDLAFPTNSYNTPLGHQFGREAAEFSEDRFNPELWDEPLSERAFEETNEHQDRRIQQEQVRAQIAAQESRVDATTIATRNERVSTRERDIFDAHGIADVGRHIRYNRDYVKGDFGLAA